MTDLIREFCKENDFKIYEDYSGRMMFGRKTIGIILKPEQNLFDVLAQLTRWESSSLGVYFNQSNSWRYSAGASQ